MNVPWENAHGGALYCLIRGDEFSAWHRLLFQRAFRLRELRAAQSLTQVQVAALAHIRQSRVSSIENGDIGSAQVNTLRKYVSALGGELDITVRLGDETFTLA